MWFWRQKTIKRKIRAIIHRNEQKINGLDFTFQGSLEQDTELLSFNALPLVQRSGIVSRSMPKVEKQGIFQLADLAAKKFPAARLFFNSPAFLSRLRGHRFSWCQ